MFAGTAISHVKIPIYRATPNEIRWFSVFVFSVNVKFRFYWVFSRNRDFKRSESSENRKIKMTYFGVVTLSSDIFVGVIFFLLSLFSGPNFL